MVINLQKERKECSSGEYIRMGRRKHAGVRDLFQGSVTGGSSIYVGDVGDDPSHGTVPGEVPE